MRRLIWLAGMTAVSVLLATQSAFAAADNACTADEVARGKATICHVPPGNPANPSTLCVGAAAVPAHLANHPGDSLGPCGPAPCDPTLVECCTDADCNAGDVCTGAETCDTQTNTCTAGTPTDCNDNDPCTDDTCDPNAQTPGCQNVDNLTCCCQQFAKPECGGTNVEEGNHCFQGCGGCTGTCLQASTCTDAVPTATEETCTGFCGT